MRAFDPRSVYDMDAFHDLCYALSALLCYLLSTRYRHIRCIELIPPLVDLRLRVEL
jgi:hypothetical protein